MKRLCLDHDFEKWGIREDEDGPYVLYSDHLAALAAKDAELAEVKEQLRLANIDAVNEATENAEAKREIARTKELYRRSQETVKKMLETTREMDAALAAQERVKELEGTVSDLHAVYSALVRKGEWGRFNTYADPIWRELGKGCWDFEFSAWLSCYGFPEQIPERMRMVAEWLNQTPTGAGRG